MYKSINVDKIEVKNEINIEHNNLFCPELLNKFENKYSYESKTRLPISTAMYDSTYYLVVYSMQTTKDFNVFKSINCFKKPVLSTPGIVYNNIDNTCFLFSYKSGKPEIINKVTLNVVCDSIEKISNNVNFVGFTIFNFKNLSIKDTNEKAVDIFINSNLKFTKKNLILDVIFYSKNNHDYLFLIASSNTSKYEIHSLINKVFV